MQTSQDSEGSLKEIVSENIVFNHSKLPNFAKHSGACALEQKATEKGDCEGS